MISALADKSNVLFTLDTGDFELLLGTKVYGTLVTTPRDFPIRQGLKVARKAEPEKLEFNLG